MSELPAVPEGDRSRETDVNLGRSADAARRETLKRLGVYGALIAPALVAALTSPASAQAVVDSGATS